MAEPSEKPPENNNNHSTFITIQPATKLGGRGTPRRKTRRPSNTNHSALVAAQTLENKLKTFRTQFQLYDQQDLCDVSILYEDGRVEMQKQVNVHSTWPMTIHEIDSSVMGTQTHHINDFDSSSCSYLFGNINDLQTKFNMESIPLTTGNASTCYNDIQQRQAYSQPPRYYMNYVAYQPNPYAVNSYENYSKNISQIYGGVDQNSDEEKEEYCSISTNPKKKRRRRSHAKIIPDQSSLSTIISKQEDENEVIDDKKPIEHVENENVLTTKPKRKRRRIRKSKKSLPSSSITGEQSQINSSSSLINEQTKEDSSSSSSTPSTPHVERMKKQQVLSTETGIHANGNASIEKDAMNMLKNGEKRKEKEKEIQPRSFPVRTTHIIPTTHPHTTAVFADVDKMEDENEKITHPVVNNAIITNISPILIDTNNETLDKQTFLQQQLSDHIQVNSFSSIY
jgi:hypothetical protein